MLLVNLKRFQADFKECT